MNERKEIEPIERDGFCQGCQEFAKLYRVAESRYRCGSCSVKEGDDESD